MLAIYGGFSATGDPAWEARDPNQYETILSGDIGTLGNNSDNCFHVFYHPSGTDLTLIAVLEGFTISVGKADGSGDHDCGGGMFSVSSNPTVTHCVFSGNSAALYGGGMDNDDSSPTVTNCMFTENGAYWGGGMHNSNSNPTVTGCRFTGNTAEDCGGGMSNIGDPSPTINILILNENACLREL